MFEKRLIEEYHNTKVPDELKEKIASAYQKGYAVRRKKQFQMVWKGAALAACCVFVFGAAVLLKKEETKLLVYGTVISNHPVNSTEVHPEAAYRRESTGEKLVIPLEIQADKKTELTISGGNIYWLDETEQEWISFEHTEQVWLEGDSFVEWEVPIQEMCYEMTVKTETKQKIYVLQVDETGDEWTIYQKD